MSKARNWTYWLIAFFAGSVLNVGLFIVLSDFHTEKATEKPRVMVVDLMQWQKPEVEPAKPSPEPAPVKQAKQKTEPVKPERPEPEPDPPELPEPKQAVPEPADRPIPKPADPMPVEMGSPPKKDPEPVHQPKRPSESKPEPPEKEPPQEPKVATINEKVDPSPEPEPETTPPLPKPVPVYKLTSLPRAIREVKKYPETMKIQGKEGTVKVAVLIDKDGNARKVTILKSAGEAFDKAAIESVMASKFSPATMNGVPVAARATFPVEFTLR